ncbi:serine/threonine-protein kinase [Streptomyces xiangluensis]|uniref:serine/threonine-protein kinase n=1 Tax=Streptomyces xiangluensis TaxID=2665720 RepID=UPI0036D8D8C7
MGEGDADVLVAERYRLDSPLGRGAMGEVWRATDEILNRPVAVKVLHTEQPEQVAATDAERFRLEAQTAGRLNHPNLVGVYDFGSHDGRLYLVMELVDGWSLAQERDRRGVLPPDEAVGIAAQMAAGLAAAHRQLVIHRDIKPGNVLLTADGTVKITDFGIARFADDATSTLTAIGKIVGSAAYLAPERGLGHPAQPASDVYSLGCVLYELLTGRPPFPGTTAVTVVKQHVEAVPVPPHQLRAEIPAPLADYVLRLLAKDPAQRPTAEQTATWLASPTEPPGWPEPQQVPPAAPPLPPPSAHLARTDGLPTVARTRATRHPALPHKALLAIVGVIVLGISAAIGVALSSDDSGGASPHPARTTAPATSPTAEQRTTESPAPASSAPVTDPGYDEAEAKKQAEEERKAAEEERKKAEEERKKGAEEERKKGAKEAQRGDG